MPTSRGWASLGAALGMGILWVAFGEPELLVIGLFLALALLASLGLVVAGRSAVQVIRRVSPAVVHEGDQAVVELTLSGRGSSSSLHLILEDRVAGLGSARFVGRVPAGTTASARYEVSCRPRGVHRVGPALVTMADPLGLAQAGGPAGATDRLVVYPAVEDLEGLPSVRGHDPSTQTAQAQFIHRAGEDFFTLREYQHGDDLRRVHWRTSAKQDELMIRQLEIPWQSRGLVFLDPRSVGYQSARAFEKAVQGAASVVRHLHRMGFSVDLWAGELTSVGKSRDRYRAAMEILAAVQPVGALDIRAVASRVRRETAGGALAMVTGVPDADDLAAFLLLSRDFPSIVLLAVAEGTPVSVGAFQRVGAVTAVIHPDGSWGPAWWRAVHSTWPTVSAG